MDIIKFRTVLITGAMAISIALILEILKAGGNKAPAASGPFSMDERISADAVRREAAHQALGGEKDVDSSIVKTRPRLLTTTAPEPLHWSSDILAPASSLIATQISALSNADGNLNKFVESPLGNWHQRVLTEAPDPNWSLMAQGQVESYMSTSLGSDVDLVSVQCGGSVCEIQAASTSPDTSEKAASNWLARTTAMAGESWWRGYGFDMQNYVQWSAADGRIFFIAFLTRASVAGDDAAEFGTSSLQ